MEHAGPTVPSTKQPVAVCVVGNGPLPSGFFLLFQILGFPCQSWLVAMAKITKNVVPCCERKEERSRLSGPAQYADLAGSGLACCCCVV